MSQYIIVDGRKIPESDFYKALAVEQARGFAYDPQLQLFPDTKVEEARAQLKAKFDSGKSIDVVVIQQ